MPSPGLDFARCVGYQGAVSRCPKCGSQSYTPPTCVICGYSAWVPSGDGDFRMASERRLGAVFAERDRQLDGDGKEDGVAPDKTYICKECGEEFVTCQSLAGHVNHHRHEARRKAQAEATGTPPAPGVAEAALWADPPAAPGGNGLHCPTCATQLPAAVRVVAESFTAEGVDDELATKLAVKAFGLLRVPG